MSEVVLKVNDLRDAFPEFASECQYPDAFIQRFLTQATAYISKDNWCGLTPDIRLLAIQYMTCHLMTLSAVNADGTATGADGNIVTSSHIGSVSVSIMAPIARNAYEQWIQSTPYGKAYWALLQAQNPVGKFWLGSPRAFGIR